MKDVLERLLAAFLAWLDRMGEVGDVPRPAPAPDPTSVPTPDASPLPPPVADPAPDPSTAPAEVVVVPSQPDRLSAHFTLSEAILSQTATRRGIDNTPSEAVHRNMIYTASQMERVRAVLKHPILISSWYRCPELNEAVGGSGTSSHMEGYSVDFTCPGFGPPLVICRALAEHALMDDVDQLIHEYGRWVHISFDLRRRREKLTFSRARGKMIGLVAV